MALGEKRLPEYSRKCNHVLQGLGLLKGHT